MNHNDKDQIKFQEINEFQMKLFVKFHILLQSYLLLQKHQLNY